MTDRTYSRRDLLKMMALLPVSMVVEPLVKNFPAGLSDGQNIILLVFDAWSAKHVPLYGYKRNTMPNLAKFADRSIVYHNHHTTSNFTVPGTSSLLTGVNPWEHRAFNLGSLITEEYAEKQIFNALAGTHNSIGFSQNIFADQLINQSGDALQNHIPVGSFNLGDEVISDEPLFKNDEYIAFSSFENCLFQFSASGVKGSLFLGLLKVMNDKIDRRKFKDQNSGLYNSNLPRSLELFTLADLMDGLLETLKSIEQPSMVYFHFYTPHAPYSPYKSIFELFSTDNFDPVRKPDHPLIENPTDRKHMELARTTYDAYLASWDSELIRLFDFFDSSGLRDNSHIFITSDHGEEFERGHVGHGDRMMYDGVLKVPLIVSSPGMTDRVDITSKTTSIDLLPTITHLTKNPTPPWASGELLPGLGGQEDPDRKLFSLDAELNSPHSPINEYSFSLHYKNYKMIKYQYPEYSGVELYDLEEDPEELNNLINILPEISKEMEKLMDDKLSEINAPSIK